MAEAEELVDPKELKIAIIGRPNVGKSTLLNALTDDERSVVSSVPGTTRDSVDTLIPATQLFKRTFTRWEQVRIIDTAGIRRRGKIEMGIESWSFLRTINAVEEAEITLLMLDGTEGLTQQDLHIAQRILEIGRPVIILVNKWDAVLSAKNIVPGTVEDVKQQEVFLDMLRKEASFLFWAQVLFLSAQEKINLHIVSRLVLNAYNAWNLDVDQKDLDALVEKLKFQPLFKNLQKITMQHNKPPVFHLHVEGKNLPHFSTHRAAENVLREVFDIGPTPIKIWSETSIQKRPRFS
jgi:GTP-binding protein